MKIFLIIIIFLFSNLSFARNIGETQITTEEGIEVFQNEKYYLLKKNVKIESDNFTLYGDTIKIFFDKDLYDIQIIDAVGNVRLDSIEYNMKASGDYLLFKVIPEDIFIKGKDSVLITEDVEMYSDGEINVKNVNGNFFIKGPNSSLKAETLYIEGYDIDGIFQNTINGKEFKILNVNDEDIAYLKTEDTDMYANIVKYSKESAIIRLENNVKIIRDGETITGDYGTLNTNNNSYKVKSKDSKKVKVIILETDE